MFVLLLACGSDAFKITYGRSESGGLDSLGESGDSSGRDTGAPDPWAGDDDTISPLYGIDVSHWNGDIDWDRVAGDGIIFSIAKATESDYYVDGEFVGEDEGAYNAGLFHGAYHFAIPDDSDGATQARWFVENGGGWVPDGTTLPGTLDIEYNPYGDTCYGLSNSEMEAWITDFNQEYISLTGRAPLVYSNADWWNRCVGSSGLGAVNPLWVAYWNSGPPTLPDDFVDFVFWQYSATGDVSGMDGDTDLDQFPGTLRELRDFALDR